MTRSSHNGVVQLVFGYSCVDVQTGNQAAMSEGSIELFMIGAVKFEGE